MKTKDYILTISIIINIVLGYWIYDLTKSDTQPIVELEKSKGREEMILNQDSLLVILLDSIKIENAVKDSLLAIKPKQIIIIKDYFDEERNDARNMSYDSSLLDVARRLQEREIN
jgi:hypothetical protein